MSTSNPLPESRFEVRTDPASPPTWGYEVVSRIDRMYCLHSIVQPNVSGGIGIVAHLLVSSSVLSFKFQDSFRNRCRVEVQVVVNRFHTIEMCGTQVISFESMCPCRLISLASNWLVRSKAYLSTRLDRLHRVSRIGRTRIFLQLPFRCRTEHMFRVH